MQIIFQCVHYAVDLAPDSEVVSGREARIKVTIWIFFFNILFQIKLPLQIWHTATVT